MLLIDGKKEEFSFKHGLTIVITYKITFSGLIPLNNNYLGPLLKDIKNKKSKETLKYNVAHALPYFIKIVVLL